MNFRRILLCRIRPGQVVPGGGTVGWPENRPARLLWVAAIVLCGAASCTPAAPASRPSAVPPNGVRVSEDLQRPMAPLSGVPLAAPTGLRLLLAASPPVIVDLDRDTREELSGVPAGADRVVLVKRLGTSAVLSSDYPDFDPNAELFVLRSGSLAAERFTSGTSFAPANDQTGIWVARNLGDAGCTLHKIAFSGRELVPSRPLDCRFVLRDETPHGLLMSMVPASQHEPSWDEIISIDSGQLVRTFENVLAVTDEWILARKRNEPVTLLLQQMGSDSRREVTPPTDIGEPSYGQVSPDGRYMAISFEHPAWPGPTQRLDLWLLDLKSFEWLRAPSMPVGAALKATSFVWAADGRLVLLGDFDHIGTAVAVWHPGRDQLEIRSVPLPERGADSFITW